MPLERLRPRYARDRRSGIGLWQQGLAKAEAAEQLCDRQEALEMFSECLMDRAERRPKGEFRNEREFDSVRLGRLACQDRLLILR